MRDEETEAHAPEPWVQKGRYVRDADGSIVVRGRSPADARRIVAAVNAVQGIRTEALERWTVQVISDPAADSVFEVDFEEAREPAPPIEAQPVVFERRVAERRQRDRRRAGPGGPNGKGPWQAPESQGRFSG